MTNNCNVAKDLMPLVIDGVASEESHKVVVDHMWKCEKCAAIYKDMQAEMQPGKLVESDYLDEAARKLHRKRKNRKRILVMLTCVATAIVVLVAVWGYDYITTRSIFPVGLDEYDAYLSRTREGGCIIMNINMKDKLLQYGRSAYGTWEEDGYVYRMSVETTLIRKYYETPLRINTYQYNDWYWIDGVIYYCNPENSEPIASIRLLCGDDEKIIYQRGDDIPLCSEELEAYYRATDEYNDYDISENRRRFDFYEKREELKQKVIELGKLVPEWH